jgi:3'(2'), 5'-bisphosphate nucleotidase
MGELLETLDTIAHRAGEAILEVYHREDQGVETKADDSPLTEADRAAHRIIAEALAEAYPDIPVLSEEGAEIPYAERSQWSRLFVVDPLDGTKEFLHKNGEFTVNIALVEEGEPVAGVVHAPALGRTYLGDGNGASRRDGARPPMAIRVAEPVAGRPWRVVGSRSHATPEVQALVDALGEAELVSMGSSLKLCLVAEGAADLYPRLGPTSEWDTAAAHAVVRAAGGVVVDTDLEPLTYNRRETILNPYFITASRLDPAWTGPLPRVLGKA